MDIGFTTVTFRQFTYDKIINIAENAGVQGIEWGGDVHVKLNNDIMNVRIAEETIAKGIEIFSYGSYYKVGVESIYEFDSVIATALAIKAKIIRVWLGQESSKNITNEKYDYTVDCLRKICNKAEEYGLIVAAEFHNNTINDSADSCLKIINDVKCANYKTYWQPIYYDERDILTLGLIKEHIVIAHVFAWNKKGKRFPLKKQYVLWADYIAILKETNAKLILEFVKHNSEIQFMKDIEILKKLSQ